MSSPLEPSGPPPTRPEPRRESTDTTRQPPEQDPLRRSRTSGVWVAVIGLGLLLVLLVVFIAQNTQSVEVSFVGWNGRAPLAVTLLIAAAAGLLLATAAGSLRIWQLRRRVKRGSTH